MNALFKKASKKIFHNVNYDLLKSKLIPDDHTYLLNVINSSIEDYGFQDIFSLISITSVPPIDMINKNKRNGSSKPVDIAISDFRPFKFLFIYKGQQHENIMLLPALISDDNMIRISSVQYTIRRVITDMVITVERNSILLNFTKRNVKIEGNPYKIKVDGLVKPGLLLFSANSFPLNKGKIRIPILLYKMIKDGLRTTIGLDFIFQHRDIAYDSEIYKKYESLLERDRGTKYVFLFKRDDIDNNVEVSKHLEKRLLPIIYCLDKIPGVDSELLDYLNGPDEKDLWIDTMCLITSDNKESIQFNKHNILSHLATMETMNEMATFDILKKINIHVDSFVDLLGICNDYFHVWLLSKLSDADKRLEVLPYIYAPVIQAMNRLLQVIKELNVDMVDNIEFNNKLTNEMRTGKIFDIKKNNDLLTLKEQINANNVYYGALVATTQNRKYGIVSNLIPNGDDVTIGNVNIIPKNNPHPTNTINPFMELNGTVIVKDPVMQKLNEQIKR